MKKFFALLKVSLCSILTASSGMGKGKRKRAVSGVSAALLIAGLGLFLSGTYSMMLLQVLAPLGMEILLFVFMGLAALISGLMFTAFGVSTTLYGGKDRDLLLSLPVSPALLVASKMFAVYLENLLLSFFILVPAGALCAWMTSNGTGQTVLFWIRLLLAVILLPALDTALSVLVGAVIAWMSTRVKHRAIGQNLIMAAYLAVVFWFSFNLDGLMESLSVNAANVISGMNWAMPIIWMGKGILGDWSSLAAFAAVCVVPAALVIFLLGKGYRRAVTAFSAVSARSDYQLSGQRASGQLRALVAKEARRFFGTPAYFWNCGMGLIMLVAMGVFALVKSGDLGLFLGEMELGELVLPLLCAAIGFCLALCPISAPSFSLEGKQLWLLREAPVRERTLIWVKTLFQMAVALPCILISMVCLGLAFGLSAGDAALMIAFALVFEVGHACLGTLLGLLFARPDLDDAAILKRSLISFLSSFGPMALLGLLAAGVWLLASKFALTLMAAMACMVGMLTALSILAAALLLAKGPNLVRRL